MLAIYDFISNSWFERKKKHRKNSQKSFMMWKVSRYIPEASSEPSQTSDVDHSLQSTGLVLLTLSKTNN